MSGMRWRSWLSACLLSVSITACASGPPLGVLDPVILPPGAKAIPIYVATTRARESAEPRRMFGGERAKAVDHARILVSVPPNHQSGEIEWPSRAPGNPLTNFVTAEREFLPDANFAADIRKSLASRPPGERDVLVFIHGYNTRFEDAVYRLAQIVHDSGFKGVPILFTWPSKGQLLDYPYDRE